MDNLTKRYDAGHVESKWQQYWEEKGVYCFQFGKDGPVYSIDTPPPTVSGDLHMGHCYSYSQPDFYARFQRMNGSNVFYPMGWDDNGLPTERLVESRFGIAPESVGAEAFIQEIIRISKQLERNYEQLWKRLGLSIDWEHTYTTISPESRKAAQYSFIDLLQKERIYHSSSPTIYCPFCRTAIANAEVADLQRQTNFITIAFRLDDGQVLPIATTRPELLPACVAVFVNPEDQRHRLLIGRKAITPMFNKEVPILSDPKADPEKGTGIVMCCTFGDTTDIKWWREHDLPLINIIGADGRLNKQAELLAGLDIESARKKVIGTLVTEHLVLDIKNTFQTVSVHERCDTPVEYIETKQWFVKIIDQKERLLDAGRKINWHPEFMLSRYEDWVRNLEWDWCISRQRYHGIPFPLWYCSKCEGVILAEISQLPVDPRTQSPSKPCKCGSQGFIPETNVMDTWMTSSLTPQIAGKWLDSGGLFNQVFPMSLRPQAHDIIRNWTFYTIVKSIYHFNKIPWTNIAISGHGLSQEGHKVSKSKSRNLTDPFEVMEKYSADAIRYWSAGTKLGEDSIINEDKIAVGQRLVTKIWNTARFSYPFLYGYNPPASIPSLVPTDEWVLSRLQRLIKEVSDSYKQYDHTSAKSKIEAYFWDIFTDNYLEMVKNRLYDQIDGTPEKESARYTLYQVLLAVLKMLAPLIPYVTEEIFQLMFRRNEAEISIHLTEWPEIREEMINSEADSIGEVLVEIATTIRRYKSEKQLPMSTPLDLIKITMPFSTVLSDLQTCIPDIKSVTRASSIELEGSIEQVSPNITVHIE